MVSKIVLPHELWTEFRHPPRVPFRRIRCTGTSLARARQHYRIDRSSTDEVISC
uniref:Transposase n=1 Tax=Haemonchus contortus TaxID=6289 RepID=A0A7I4Z0R0_HAECO